MNKMFNPTRLQQLKNDAHENIESYVDPQKPKALAIFTQQIKTILQANPSMLQSVPEYLPVALFGRVKFSENGKLQWTQWLKSNVMPAWDDFKVSIAFNNEDLALVKTIREYNQDILIEAGAVLFLLTHEVIKPEARKTSEPSEDEDDERDHDDYEGSSDNYPDAGDDYDEISFN